MNSCNYTDKRPVGIALAVGFKNAERLVRSNKQGKNVGFKGKARKTQSAVLCFGIFSGRVDYVRAGICILGLVIMQVLAVHCLGKRGFARFASAHKKQFFHNYL